MTYNAYKTNKLIYYEILWFSKELVLFQLFYFLFLALQYYYPKHEIAFAYLVDSQKLFPDKVQPSVIFALAQNESIPGVTNQNKTFLQMFGVNANSEFIEIF